MKSKVIESYVHLLHVELLMRLCSLQAIHNLVRRCDAIEPTTNARPTPAELCHAMDLACVFYPKRVFCLQRSAATTLLLRRHSFKAEMVIGAQMLPFKFHAWVEIGNTVINDKPYMLDIYQVLERC